MRGLRQAAEGSVRLSSEKVPTVRLASGRTACGKRRRPGRRESAYARFDLAPERESAPLLPDETGRHSRNERMYTRRISQAETALIGEKKSVCRQA